MVHLSMSAELNKEHYYIALYKQFFFTRKLKTNGIKNYKKFL